MSALLLSSTITAVTVYRRGALVTRTANLTQGEDGFPSHVQIDGLPLTLDDSSLRVELVPQGDGQAPVAGDVRVTLAVPEAQPDLRPPTDEELDAARLELSQAQRAEADLQQVASHVDALEVRPRGVPEPGHPPMPSPTASRLALLRFRRERLERLYTALTAATERSRVAQERVQTLKERERRATRARNPREFEARKAVVVALRPADDDPARALQLRLRYLVAGARWAPSYVLRVDRDLGRGTLEVRALVGQATGERWSDVALSLSTAHPQRWTELPELRSLRVGQRQPPPLRAGWRPAPTGAEQLYEDFDRGMPRPVVPQPKAQAVSRPPPPPIPDPDLETRTMAGTGRPDLLAGVDFDALDGALERLSAPPSPARSKQARGRSPGAPVPMAPGPPAAMAAPMVRSAARPAPAGIAPSRAGPAEVALGGGGGSVGGLATADEDAPAGPLRADPSLLDYGSLRLWPAGDPRRGSLRRADRALLYGQRGELAPALVADALARIRTALQTSAALEGQSPPPGHRWARGADGFDYAYEAEAPATLDADGQLHGLGLQSPPVALTPRYITVPRETQDVFRVLVLRNPLEAPLLPGPVDVYIDGRFALATTLEQTPPRGRVELGLGVEQAIKIARNVAFEDSASGLLKRHRELEHRIRVELHNHLAVAATVEVRERLPVAQDGQSDVEIQELEVDPAWETFEQEDPPLEGGRVWKVEVPAHGRQALTATWTLRIPKDHEIIGGNRRER